MTVTPSNIPSIDNSPRPEIIADVEQTLKGGFRFLQFPARLEENFLDYFYDRTIKRLRVALLTGIILYALFGLDDLLLLPGFIEKTLFIRFAIVCPVGFAVFALTFSPHFKRLMQPAVWLAMQVGGLGIIAIVALDPQQVGRYHNTGLILVVMYTLALVGMRFWYGVTWAITFLCAYLIMAIPGPLPPPLLVHDIFNIVAAINIGAISNYMMERYVRKDFLQTILVEAEKVQLQETGIKLRELSISDELTSLANRRHFESFFEQEWLRALRNREFIALILLDIDAFKAYNDTYGHQAGDDCLKAVADEIKRCAKRPGDLAARYGGEEFAVVLAGTDSFGAESLAETCRARVHSLAIEHRESMWGRVTISAGIAAVVPDEETHRKELVRAADEALYQAKRQGRNRVAVTEQGYGQPQQEIADT